ncbi:Csm3 protein [Saccharomycopsis crataegensis]|uniref:Chromosome segregation in meiosis protein n=1 Tax=Saccharomycopsis crataegensis TaxID=43959 RepID=A0AAV5QGI8_9ASCO|nr:Csm3 protein [Saccharomycopsis crataegensis]
MEDLFEQDGFVTVRQPESSKQQEQQETAFDDEPLFVTEDAFEENNTESQFPTTEPISNTQYDPLEMSIQVNSNSTGGNGKEEDDILGFDNVNIKTRRKVVSLSEDQLLSNHGLPYIKRNLEKRVKFQSSTRISKSTNKKHVSFTTEYDNATKLLQFYQLWAHKVFPKANFENFLQICYTKHSLSKGRVLSYRRQCISDEQDRLFNRHMEENQALVSEEGIANQETNNVSHANDDGSSEKRKDDGPNSTNNDNAFSDTEMNNVVIRRSNGLFVQESDDEGDDRQSITPPLTGTTGNNDNENLREREGTQEKKKTRSNGLFVDDDDDDDDDGGAISREVQTTHGNSVAAPPENLIISTSETQQSHSAPKPAANDADDFDDDFDDDELISQLDEKSKSKATSSAPEHPDDMTMFDEDQVDEDEMAVLREMGL